jgi:hypothetical protein
MRTIELKKIMNAEKFIKQTPSKEHYTELIREDCMFLKDGKPVGLYMKIPDELVEPIRRASLTTKYVKTYRTHKALPTQSSVFGSLPRIAVRNDYCRFSEKTKSEKGNTTALFDFLPKLTEIYQKYLPQQYNHDVNVIQEQVREDYRLVEEAPFTTANINVNHAIKYHRDTGNFRGNLSNVLILRGGIIGGELVFPEYGFALSQEDGYLAIFDGQNEIHGVMPIIQTTKNPYRASIVYYTLENMKHCYPFEMELERIQKLSTSRAKKRALNIRPK